MCNDPLSSIVRSALLLVVVLPAYSQLFSIGVKGGIPLTEAYSAIGYGYGAITAYDRRYIIGPTAEVHLPFHLSFEVDALYRRNGFDYYYENSIFGPVFTSRTAVNDWQVPVLGKYEMKFGRSGHLRTLSRVSARVCREDRGPETE